MLRLFVLGDETDLLIFNPLRSSIFLAFSQFSQSERVYTVISLKRLSVILYSPLGFNQADVLLLPVSIVDVLSRFYHQS